jgi:hypothetical protein
MSINVHLLMNKGDQKLESHLNYNIPSIISATKTFVKTILHY